MTSKRIFLRVLGALPALVAMPAMASTDANLTILAVGSQAGVGGYIQVSPGTSGNCPANIIYLDLTTDSGRGMLSIALSARAGGRPIARVDYTGGGASICNMTLIQL